MFRGIKHGPATRSGRYKWQGKCSVALRTRTGRRNSLLGFVAAIVVFTFRNANLSFLHQGLAQVGGWHGQGQHATTTIIGFAPLHVFGEIASTLDKQWMVVTTLHGSAGNPSKAIKIQLPLQAFKLGKFKKLGHDLFGKQVNGLDPKGSTIHLPTAKAM